MIHRDGRTWGMRTVIEKATLLQTRYAPLLGPLDMGSCRSHTICKAGEEELRAPCFLTVTSKMKTETVTALVYVQL